MTNLERIRAMTAHGMAKAIYAKDDMTNEVCLQVCGVGGACPNEPITEAKCKMCIEDWLNSEVTE